MNSLISSLFKSKKSVKAEDSSILKSIKLLPKYSDLLVFNEVKIYHHAEIHTIPLLIVDKYRGIYLFEKKRWSFEDLDKATIQKVENASFNENTLAYNTMQDIIKQKFNELIHNDGAALFNFLLLENLKQEEYKQLDDSIKKYLPEEKIIFKDSLNAEIFKKLENTVDANYALPSIDEMLGNLLIQYTLIDNEQNLHFCTQEQINFIDTPLKKFNNLSGDAKSGKTACLLLKSIVEVLNNKELKILIIKPNTLSKDILQKQFLNIIEHAIIEIDLSAIEILTPLELVNKHLSKLKYDLLHDSLHIDEKLMRKPFHYADIVMCDDAEIYNEDFIQYLKHIQENKHLLLVNSFYDESTFTFENNFVNKEKSIKILQTNPHAKALHLLADLTEKTDPKNILVLSNTLSREKLKEDLNSFIEAEVSYLEAQQNLLSQNLDTLLLATYDDIVDLEFEYVILMDICFNNLNHIHHALNLANHTAYILYDTQCQEIQQLKETFENSKI